MPAAVAVGLLALRQRQVLVVLAGVVLAVNQAVEQVDRQTLVVEVEGGQ